MVELNTIFADMEAEKVSLFPYEVGEEKSVTLEMNNQYAIFLDTFRVKTVTETKWILAHELGHCATGCTHKVSSSLDLVEKHEYKANRWAIERYIPFEKLSVAIQEGYAEKWQLAEYFDMPESFIEKALNYYFVTKQRKLA
ncbi:ImmA/IrrE family metallo-endopeptidase [Scatolibacter rhodanostii]|uniref:ImmA/IrrE family metallo-endopeptidase n=1 Tax=Scatolibacter rhodanostii TaxID=2014781 RepID=UPI000C06C5E9|nr:ImmA/IrrE family metallo-endopeptidase [Scatolibacter rhodanostii]